MRRTLLPAFALAALLAGCASEKGPAYPKKWFEPVSEVGAPSWEILPQAAGPGEVILSKRNELGVLSNFAATTFVYRGVRYASVEGFWQMMFYPEGPDDERTMDIGVDWKFTRQQVGQMVAFAAKHAGDLGEENMRKLNIDWVTFEGHRIPYKSKTRGEHYRLVVEAMREKLRQNPEVRRVLLSTGTLTLKPDHHQDANDPDEWRYFVIWMEIRAEIRAGTFG